MGAFLNSYIPFAGYREISADPYFVDKTGLLEELFPAIGRRNKYFCITRPRRFGKSVMANMVGAFFEKTVDGSGLFGHLAISKSKEYQKHLNNHNVIYIDFSRVPEKCESYDSYITRISDGIKEELVVAYPELSLNKEQAVWNLLLKIFIETSHQFVFVLDEWDAAFHMSFVSEAMQKEYLLFLKNLLKDQVYVELAYMTGVLPITKYSSGSELNMFLEYNMVTKKKFSGYFGFDDKEVDQLFDIYKNHTADGKITREDLRVWYDGYYAAYGQKMYNPRSIVCALSDNELANYWTSSGPYDEIFYYIRNNIEAVREDLVYMISGEGVKAEIQDYAAVSMNLNTRNEIYSAMVVYGMLTYDESVGKVFIPNREIMEQFKTLLMTKDSLVYLAARDLYRVEREDKAGEGYVDFIFYPERRNQDAFILELKIDSTPEDAIAQIIDEKYALRFAGKLGEKPEYTGRILAVGISYNRKTKEHCCKVESLDRMEL